MDFNNCDWNVPCNDEDILRGSTIEGDSWIIDPSELESMYDTIEATGTLTLEWRNPGRRPPSPFPVKEDKLETPTKDAPPEEKSNFDFMDEVNSLHLRVRRECEDTLRGSAKKKTSSFDGIVSNMMRHKRIQQMEREADDAQSPGVNP